MTIIIGGHETGLLDSSFTLLNRNDRTRLGDPGHGEQTYVNVSNGNLLIQQRDAYLPSLGEDFSLVRTYNARGAADDAHGHEDARWDFSTLVRINTRNDGGSTYYEVEYGDGAVYQFRLDTTTGQYVSFDGPGAYETLQVLSAPTDHDPAFVVTRANQTQLTFNKLGQLLSAVDTNGVRVDYTYEADRLVQVNDDQGHVINYVYVNGVLTQVTDETANVLVQYNYDAGRLSEVIDRDGHSTKYFYTTDGFINRIVLPAEQTVDGQLQTFDTREVLIDYEDVNWHGDTHARAKVVKQITDAEGGITTFDYAFQFTTPGATQGNGKGHLNRADDGTLITDKFFLGGTTQVVDALGNARATSNDAEFRAWRVANGYYDLYDAAAVAADPTLQSQMDAIRAAHSLTYTYGANGLIGEVVDQQGYKTTYTYDSKENLVSTTDRNGYAAVTSDSDYFRAQRAELGYVDAAGLGKLVAELTDADKTAILAHYTTTYTYDERGNRLSRRDNAGHLTTYTYTAFNKLASETSAVGNALVTSDDTIYQEKRVALGYSALVAGLSSADRDALIALNTTEYDYDARQNLIERRDPGGDITRFEYDQYGNLVRRVVYLDRNDLTDPAKQQVVQYFYDAFGNNVETIDGEGNQTHSDFDHFGNVTRFVDGNGGITTYTYDADNRLLTTTDPENHTTVNTYDAVGNRISMTDANGHAVVYLYDRNNMLLATVDNAAVDPALDRVKHNTYDVVGNRTTMTDAEGRVTTYVYDARRELVEMVTAEVAGQDGNLTQYHTTYAYDGEGNRIRTTNSRGFTTETLYTTDGLVRQDTQPTGHVTRFVYDANHNNVTIISGVQLPEARRQILRFAYDQEDQLISKTDAEGNVTQYRYDAPGNRVALTDANGNTHDFEYDRNNRQIREIRPAVIDPQTGVATRYTVLHQYDANGNEIATTDENGHVTRFTFDKDNRRVMIEDANGVKTVYTYDSRNNRTGVFIGVQAHVDVDHHVVIDDQTDAQATTYQYDEFNQLVAKTDGVGNALAASDASLYQDLRVQLGFAALVADLSAADMQALRNLHTEHYTYDRVGNYIRTVDKLGRATDLSYDALNRLVERSDALGQVTAYRYDGRGNRTQMTDANGHVTTYAYDAGDRLVDATDALGVTKHSTYDTFGNLLAETRADGTADARTTQYVYDLNNRLTQTVDPLGHTSAYEYDAVGNRLRVVDGRGNATDYVYDALNRNIKMIDPLGFETRMEYDGVGNRVTMVDARGGISRLTYDPGNRLVESTDGEGRVTRFEYDVRGNRIVQTTAFGTPEAETTQYVYDAENNLRAIIDAEGNTTTHDYDRVYNRIRTTDGNGHSTSYVFDAVNRLLQITDAQGAATTYSYDAVGNRLEQVDALGRVTTFTYDARDRMLSQFAPDGVETRYAYDALGNRISITRAANTADAQQTTFTYDADDRLIAQVDTLGHATTYEYDANHNRTRVTDPLGHVTTYVYDADNRVSEVVDPLGNTVTYRYDGNGNRVQVIDARGFAATTYYNADNEVELAVDNEGFATSYVYDHNGNMVSQTLHAVPLALPLDPAVVPVPATDPADQTVQFSYDNLNRRIARIDGEGFTTQYVYDAVGNRIETRQALDRAATQFEVRRSFYDVVDREVASLTAEGFLTENSYDAVGNLIERIQYDQPVTAPADGSAPQPAVGDLGRHMTFAYDAKNRLVRETSALGVATEYQYDARDNRVAMTEAAGTPDARTALYRYDAADRYIETTNAIGVVTHLELDADGNVLTRREAFGTPEERVYTFTYDGDHRVVSQTDALGVITQTQYDANGNVVSRTAAAGLPEARTETFEYDRNNRRAAAVNAAGERVEYAYDAAGNRIRVTQAPGLPEERTNLFTFDRDNRMVASTDGLGTVANYLYDGAGNKLETIQAVGLPEERHTFYVYDQDNRMTQITDPMGGVTQYEYDVLGNQTRIIDANGGVQENAFDVLGRVVTSLSASGTLTVNTYDLRNNVVSTTQSFADGSDARTSTYAYDLLNRQTRITDGEGFSSTIEYDAFGNQTQVTRGLYLVDPTDPAYDAAKAARTFEQSNTFVYDGADRILSLTDAEGNVTAYTYDAVGNRLSLTEAANTAPRTTSYVYDLANRQIETITPEGGVSRCTYDKVGNKIAEDILQSGDSVTGVFIHKTYEYDKNGHMTAEVDPFGVRTEHVYDALGNMTATRFAAGTADERTVRMEYDLNNRKTADIDALGNRTEYTFDAIGNRIKLVDPLGHVAHYYFDGANRLTTVVDPEGFINAFAYDAAGNQTQERVYMTPAAGPVDDNLAPTPVSSGTDRVTSLQYDRANRAIVRTESDGRRTEFTYDGVGNKIVEKTFANTTAPRVMTYVYDHDNRLTQFTDVDGTVDSFTYDGANNRLSDVVSNANDANPVRATFYQYDLNNRRVSETFDPNGLDIVVTTAYDQVGNVVAKTDGNGHTTTYSYDLNNRQVTQADAHGNTTQIAYDAVGNRVAVTDARGNTTNFVYDANNRQTQEIRPQVEDFTIADGTVSERPAFTTQYDAAGNAVQVVDAEGFVTTRYFDGDGRMIAELNGDNVLRTYSYDAAGDRVSETTYMTRLSAADHDPASLPTPPAGEARTITREYDLAGRLTRTVYPQAEITTLVDTDTANPTPVKVLKQVDERKVYDAFGQEVETFDREGNRSISYYDVKGRKVAAVDALGFLVEWDYDAQDNQIEQRVYTQPLDPATVTPDTRPVPPGGEVFVTSRRYDAASRVVEEQAPQIAVFDPVTQASSFVRPTTTYTYDQVGNQLTKTLGAGTAQAVTEYSYYDAANRRVAVVNGSRIANLYSYDANNNLTERSRLFNALSGTVDLSQLTANTDFAALAGADPSKDEATTFDHDAMNRLTRETDLMGPGTSDDLSKVYRYDAVDNRTSLQDEDGFVAQSSYDALKRVVQTINPDGNGTRIEYDAAGNQIFVFTGEIANSAAPATNIAARLDNALTVSWNVAGRGTQTWVVYDTASHTLPEEYANRSVTQVNFTGSAQATLGSPATGSTLFFRVVTQDGAGNLTWTEEQSLTVPPRFSAVSVARPDDNTLTVSARFDAGVVNPELTYGAPGNLAQSTPFVLQADGSYLATINGATDPAALDFELTWQDAAGRSYASAEGSFQAVSDQVGITSDVSEGTVTNGTTMNFQILVHTSIPTAYAAGLALVQAQWRLAGSSVGFAATAATGTDTGQGLTTFDLTLGDTTPLDAGVYEVVLTGVRADGTAVSLDTFNFEVGAGGAPATFQSLSWVAPNVGDGQVVVIDGQRADSVRENGRVLVDDAVTAAGTVGYAVFYAQSAATPNTVSRTSTAISHTVQIDSTPITQTSGDPPVTTITGYDLGVSATFSAAEIARIAGTVHLGWRAAGSTGAFTDVAMTLSGNTFSTTLANLAAGQYELRLTYTDVDGNAVVASEHVADTAVATSSETVTTGYDLAVAAQFDPAETATIAGGVHLAWRPAGSGEEFANDVTLDATAPDTFSTTLANLAAGQYDLKIYYTDTQGREVIVAWQRVDAAASATEAGRSQTVLARETGGTITRDAQGAISINPGFYTGALDTGALLSALTLDVTATGNVGDSRSADGRTTGYFTENTYNALNYRTGTNENDGLWREFGVDGNGRTVETRLFGEKGAATFIASYTAVDARGRKTAEFGLPAVTSTGTARPVRRYAYDVLDNVTADTDALGNTRRFEYNALGTLVRQIDALGHAKETRIDQFGRDTATVTELGNATLKFYDLQGRLIKVRDPLGIETGYTYDTFDRKLTETNGLGMATADPNDHTMRFAYDQRDRLVHQEQPQGWHLAHDDAAFYQAERQRLGYTVTELDANGNPVVRAKLAAELTDAERQALIDRYSVTYAYDGRNNRTSTVYPLSQRTDQVYDALGRVADTQLYLNGVATHAEKAYDAYGNVIGETDPEGRVKTKLYGEFGRIQQEFDEDGIEIDYTYDVYGRIVRESGPNGKDIRRTYDDAGRLLSIQDLATGVSTTYTYDLLGRRVAEVVTTPGHAHDRNLTYAYDALSQTVRWADSVTGENLNYFFDAEGNRVRAFTDVGYDPLGQNTDANPNYRYIDHFYTFDAARRVTKEVQRNTDPTGNVSETLVSIFGYDAANNRITWNNAGVVVNYLYDANGRAVQGDFFEGTDSNRQAWTYDAMGNVLSFKTFKNGALQSSTINQYNDANRTTRTASHTEGKDDQTTTQAYDKSLRITQTVLTQGDKTFYYNHTYFGDGREKTITAYGDANGSSTSTYDANKIRTSVNLGKGDGQDRAEVKNFVSDNEGHILFQSHDDGKSSTTEIREYLYANGNPVGEQGHGTDGTEEVKLDTGSYNLIQNLGDSFPGGNLTYTVRAGDTLQGIASLMYGNPSLWFVLADANGLNIGEPLKAGTVLQIPNSVKTGLITNDNHKVYSESELVGSTLPNLKTPPPPKHGGGCGSILAIIIVVVIAVVVSVVTAGVAAPLAAAAVSAVGATAGSLAAFVVTAAVYAVVGAVVAAVGSIVQQGLFIALGYQDSFSWKAVASAAVSGALSGAAQGVGAAAKIAAGAGELSNAGAQYAKVAAAALKTASAASKQLIDSGKITSWTSLASAAIGGYVETGQAISAGATKAANLATTQSQLNQAASLYQAATRGSQTLTTINSYVTPWVQLAETYVRNDGKLTPTDWASAVGSTLSQAVSDKYGSKGNQFSDKLFNSSLTLGTNLLVAGALRLYGDKAGAQNYFENSVGQVVGQFIGDYVGQGLKAAFFAEKEERYNRVYDPSKGTFVDARTGEVVRLPGNAEVKTERFFSRNANGEYVDQYGNPAPILLADSGEIVSDVAPGLLAGDPDVTDDATPTVEAHEIQRGDSFWKIAKEQLGPDATNEEIQRQVYALMELNPGVDPMKLRPGQEINVIEPNSGISISAGTLAAYGKSDAQYQAHREEQARLRALQEAMAQQSALLGAGGESLPDDAIDPVLWEGALFGPGIGLTSGASALRTGKYLLTDPSVREYFTEKLPSEGVRIEDYYRLDLEGRLVETSPEYFTDLAKRRDLYLDRIKELPDEYAIPDDATVQAAEDLSQRAGEARNKALDATREQLSPAGRRFSESLKATGKSWNDLADRYAKQETGRSYSELSDAEKLQVNRTIVEKSGVSRGAVDAIAVEAREVATAAKILRGARVVGKGLTVVGAAVDTYSVGKEVYTSVQTGQWENTAKEVTRVGVSWGAAAVGAKAGAAGGAALGGAIGSVVPVLGTAVGAAAGAVIGGLAGGAAGYIGGSALVESTWSYARSGYNSVTSWFR